MSEREWWVDAAAGSGGDGSKQRPFSTLTPALKPCALIHLATGIYEGPLELPEDVIIEGSGDAVIHAEAPGTTLRLSRGTLRNLRVQGGAVAISVSDFARIERVTLSGFRTTGLELQRDAMASASEIRVLGSISETVGVRLLPGATAAFDDAKFEGALRHAVHAQGATLSLQRALVTGPVGALHLIESDARVVELRAAGGRGPAVFTAQSTLSLERLLVDGHEFALQAARGSSVFVRTLSSRGAHHAGVSEINSDLQLAHAAISDSGAFGALQLLGGTVRVEDLSVRNATSVGVMARHARFEARHVSVAGVRHEPGQAGELSDGDGVMFRGGSATLAQLEVSSTAGTGLSATSHARVTVGEFNCHACTVAAALVERGGTVNIHSLRATGSNSAALVIPDQADADVGDLTTDAVLPQAVWAECNSGARVVIRRLSTPVPPSPSRCIEYPTSPEPPGKK